jgi:hypothetical protein
LDAELEGRAFELLGGLAAAAGAFRRLGDSMVSTTSLSPLDSELEPPEELEVSVAAVATVAGVAFLRGLAFLAGAFLLLGGAAVSTAGVLLRSCLGSETSLSPLDSEELEVSAFRRAAIVGAFLRGLAFLAGALVPLAAELELGAAFLLLGGGAVSATGVLRRSCLGSTASLSPLDSELELEAPARIAATRPGPFFWVSLALGAVFPTLDAALELRVVLWLLGGGISADCAFFRVALGLALWVLALSGLLVADCAFDRAPLIFAITLSSLGPGVELALERLTSASAATSRNCWRDSSD